MGPDSRMPHQCPASLPRWVVRPSLNSSGNIVPSVAAGCKPALESPASQHDRSVRHPAAVHDERLAGNVAAGLARQQQNRSNQFLRISPPTQGGSAGEGLLLLLGQETTG